jgi:carbamoyltransferase
MIILGVCGGPRGTHEPGIAIIKNSKILFASQEERFNRNKNSISCFPQQILKKALNKLNIKPNEIDIVAHPGITYDDMKMRWKSYLNHNFGIKTKNFVPVHHQMCHVNTAYYQSGFNDAIIISLDGVGDRSSGMVVEAQSKEKPLKIIKNFSDPLNNSVGFFWDLITQLIGFDSLEEAYKTMGLAPYGHVTYNLNKMLKVKNGVPLLNRHYINDQWKYISFHCLEPRITEKLCNDLNFKRRLPSDSIRQKDKNLAASAQSHLEKVIIDLIKYYFNLSKSSNLILSGGVALNSKMCGTLNELDFIKKMYVPQLPSDGNLALGAAIQALSLNNRKKVFTKNPYFSINYNKKDVISAIKLTNRKLEKYNETKITNILNKNKVIGFFTGKSEFGPRALGGRSIIASPIKKNMKDIVNSKIKFRESFRPFAPVIRDIDLEKYFFVGTGNYEFMNYVIKARPILKKLAPAIVHEDGTSRVQVLRKGTNKKLYNLLGNWLKKTGCPVLLNTSFNLKGEPIVETPTDAIRTFYSSGIDCLVLEDFIIKK